jgi:hypothetical protein
LIGVGRIRKKGLRGFEEMNDSCYDRSLHMEGMMVALCFVYLWNRAEKTCLPMLALFERLLSLLLAQEEDGELSGRWQVICLRS